MVQYLSPNKLFAVLYRSIDGTYDVVRVVGGEGPATWPIVRDHWDWFQDARINADEFDRQEMS